MGHLTQSWESQIPVPVSAIEPRNWYALLTQARHEKIVAHRLGERGISAFLPLVTEVRRWRNRKRKVELPLFSCYVFAKLLPTNEDRLRALRIDGVFSLVGPRGTGTPIPDEQIESVQKLVEGRSTVGVPPLPQDWTTCAHPQWSFGRRRRHPGYAKRRKHPCCIHRCHSEIPGAPHRRV